mmetsp:Transcript_122059/g.379972  ORF Transcript_122059/g.379972 Transcript_122059/m.379972 type:complete len:243 (-) Transcript_122059:30-758(-)
MMLCGRATPLRALLLLSAASLAAVASAESLPAEQQPEVAALAADDECHSSGFEQCSLNALQLKGHQAKPSTSADEMADAETLAGPIYEEADYDAPYNESGAKDGVQHIEAKGFYTGRVVTGYHQTSPSIGRAILRGGFRPGHAGYCGGGIYFASSARATGGKAIGYHSHHGFIIKARIALGREKHMGMTCMSSRLGVSTLSRTPTSHFLAHMHADSFVFNPVDGVEYVIANPHRVLSMHQHR